MTGVGEMGVYERRLTRDLPRWREAGWLTAEGETAIRSELRGQAGMSLGPVLAILGAVLMGFAIMSFVAANWQEMSKLARIGLLLAGLAGSYMLAGVLSARGQANFAEAATLTGVSIFGAAIMLISQMYHIDGHPPDAVLTWACGALLAAILLASNPALVLTALLVGLWSAWETAISGTVFWWFLAGWTVVAGLFAWRGWQPGLHFSAVLLAIWIVSLGYVLDRGHAHELVAALGAGILALGIGGQQFAGPHRSIAAMTPGYGFAIAFAGLFALQFIDHVKPVSLIVLAALTLAGCVAAIAYGWRTVDGGMLWLGYVAFSVELLALYFKTVGTLLGSSLFFFSSGLIVILLAFVAFKLRGAQASDLEATS